MSACIKFIHSAVGAKIIMAVTGCFLFLYVVGHMVGNLQVYQGPEKLNAYALFLHSHMGFLWVARLGVLTMMLLHVYTASRLTLQNRAARPVAYVMKENVRSGLAANNMYVSGTMIFFFVAYHLAQFTLRWTNPELASLTDAQGRFDVYRMVVAGFQNPVVTGSYVVAMTLLGLHLWHGVSSMFQSVGLNRPQCNTLVGAVGPVFAAVIVLGNISMPVAILSGFIK